MKPKLEPVPSSIPAPPYPADTRTAGWAFRLDCHRIVQSDTWTLAGSAGMRAQILLLWFKSWMQIPAGSLPDDDDLIAAIAEMTPEMFQGHRKILMRNWYRASDGRLYHPTVTEMVLNVVTEKAKTAARKRKSRDRQKLEKQSVAGDVTGPSRVTLRDGHGVSRGGSGGGGGGGSEESQKQSNVKTLPSTPASPESTAPKKRAAKVVRKATPEQPAKGAAVWDAYSAAYIKRYGTAPVRNALVNANLARVVDLVGIEAAPQVAAFYVELNDPFYVKQRHPPKLLMQQIDGIHTQWKTKGQVDPTQRMSPAALRTAEAGQRWIEQEEAKDREAARVTGADDEAG